MTDVQTNANGTDGRTEMVKNLLGRSFVVQLRPEVMLLCFPHQRNKPEQELVSIILYLTEDLPGRLVIER